ncbi:MAG: hypothetical protein AAGB48_05285 [Planctomycetota bacterium]
MITRILFVLIIVALAGVVTYGVTKPPGTGYRVGELIPQTEGVENVIVFGRGVLSGSEPEGDAGFDTLTRFGVKSILSVDATAPDLERAKAQGIRTVHVPLRYDGITGPERAVLARAVRDLPRPIFVHCHHGKHRGPAAAAIALVGTGELDTDQAVTLMRVAGTSEHYQGLYDDVADAIELRDAVLDAVPDESLPEAATVEGLSASMAEINESFKAIRLIADAGWETPSDHPDLELEHAAPRLTDLFRALAAELAGSSSVDAGYAELMRLSVEQAQSLEDAIADEDWTAAEFARDALASSCVDCHWQYR